MAALAPKPRKRPAPRSVLTQLNCAFVCGEIVPAVIEPVAACGCLLEETKKTRQLLTAECILTFSVYGMILNKKLGVKFINYHQQKKNHS